MAPYETLPRRPIAPSLVWTARGIFYSLTLAAAGIISNVEIETRRSKRALEEIANPSVSEVRREEIKAKLARRPFEVFIPLYTLFENTYDSAPSAH